jgi:cold shock CspA family protein
MQGVIKAYDPTSGLGSLLREPDREEIELSATALEGSIFRFLRQGQRVNFDLDADGFATHLRFGSEGDMLTPMSAPVTDPYPATYPQ